MANTDRSFESIIEESYWRFDARRNGAKNKAPIPERDAFKQECRRLVNTAIDMLEEMEKAEQKEAESELAI